MSRDRIFIPLVGEFSNVGDVMHRSELLNWLKGNGTLYIYIGNAPEDFVSSLAIPNNSKIYKSLFKWLLALLFSPFNQTNFVFNSGEVTLSRKRLIFEILLLPFLFLVKLKKGEVLRIGIACISNAEIKNKKLWRWLLGYSTKIYWRTYKSFEIFELGSVIPDLAFNDAFLGSKNEKLDVERRNVITISMRWDRPFPSDNWFQSISNFCKEHAFEIYVVSQVRKDNQRCEDIAQKLNGKVMTWKGESHILQESKLREIYKRSIITISDRLHVLVAAVVEGAIPCTILTKFSGKVQDHFDVLDIQNITIVDSTLEINHQFLLDQLKRKNEIDGKIKNGQTLLKEAKESVRHILQKVL